MHNNNLFTLEGIKKYRLKHTDSYLLVDTNIFLLFLIGTYDEKFLKECTLMKNNGKCYEKKHFDLLKKILSIFVHKVAITPHIVSEISMLSRIHKPSDQKKFSEYFTKIIKEIERCVEHHITLSIITNNGALVDFGFADVSLIESAKEKKSVVLTDEFEIQRVFGEDLPVIYFTNVVANQLIL
jgi:hypothetical protein